jgi:hypothetical protein
MNGIPPFPGNAPTSFHSLPQSRVVYAHLPVSALHTYPPQDATMTRLCVREGPASNKEEGATDLVGCSFFFVTRGPFP